MVKKTKEEKDIFEQEAKLRLATRKKDIERNLFKNIQRKEL